MRRAVLAGIICLAPSIAAAQGPCLKLSAQQCTVRFTKPIDRINAGHITYCNAIVAAKIQSDFFATVNNKRVYQCSIDVACSNTSMPIDVRAKFCP